MYSDSIRLLQPTILFSRACGVCPSAVRKLWIPLVNKIYAVVLAISCCWLAPFHIYFAYQTYNDITAFVFICHAIMDLVSLLTILTSAFVFSEELVRFFAIMESVQRSLFGLNIRQPPNPSRRSQLLWMFAFIILMLASFAYLIIQSHNAIWLLAIPRDMIHLGSFLKTRVLLSLVDEKFSLLIWHLDDLNDRWPLFLPRPPDVSFREFTSVANYRRTKFVLPSHDDRAVTALKINEFNKTHLKLVYACKTLQRIFSVEWFFSTISFSLQFIVYFYWMSTLEDKIALTTSFFKLVVTVLTLVINLTLVTKIKEKSEKVAILVHDLLDEDRHDDDVIDELEQFSMSLLHRKANFSAAGFFDYDLKLVSKIASLLAPIVLFLVQNNNRPRAGRKKHFTATNTTKV